MMRSYVIALFILCFSLVCNMFNMSGIFDISIATGGAEGGLSQALVTDLTAGAVAGEQTPLGGFTSIPTLLMTLFSSLVSVLFIIPLLTSLGVPVLLASVIQVPIWMVYGWDMFNWVGNRPQNQ